VTASLDWSSRPSRIESSRALKTDGEQIQQLLRGETVGSAPGAGAASL
jgi:hypothetical protein